MPTPTSTKRKAAIVDPRVNLYLNMRNLHVSGWLVLVGTSLVRVLHLKKKKWQLVARQIDKGQSADQAIDAIFVDPLHLHY